MCRARGEDDTAAAAAMVVISCSLIVVSVDVEKCESENERLICKKMSCCGSPYVGISR